MPKSTVARQHITARVPPRTVQQMQEIAERWVINIPGTTPSKGDVIANAVDVLHRMIVPQAKEVSESDHPLDRI